MRVRMYAPEKVTKRRSRSTGPKSLRFPGVASFAGSGGAIGVSFKANRIARPKSSKTPAAM